MSEQINLGNQDKLNPQDLRIGKIICKCTNCGHFSQIKENRWKDKYTCTNCLRIVNINKAAEYARKDIW